MTLPAAITEKETANQLEPNQTITDCMKNLTETKSLYLSKVREPFCLECPCTVCRSLLSRDYGRKEEEETHVWGSTCAHATKMHFWYDAGVDLFAKTATRQNCAIV